MPRNRRMRREAKKLNDGWSFDENWFFTNLLLHEAEVGNLKEVALLTGACQRISAAMNSRFGRRFNLFSVKQKVEQLRHRNKSFNKFLHTPGVMYDIENCESLVNEFYWRAVDRKMETPLFREFRVNGEPFHLKLSYIFDEAGVATFPKDLTGSPEWPIHVRDSEDDEKAVVPFAETSGCVPPLPIAFLGNDVITVEKTNFGVDETLEKDGGSGGSTLDID